MISDVNVSNIDDVMKFNGLPYSTNKVETSMTRYLKLAKTQTGLGHDCMLKGIVVAHTLTATQTFMQQWQRYHFHDIVSSQSKMHCILDFDILGMCHELVDYRIINLILEMIEEYRSNPNPSNYERILYNLPMGFKLKSYVITNYLQLKTIYKQRSNHRLREWHTYCDWILTLPYMKEILHD